MVAMSERTILSWVQDVLEVIYDYWFVRFEEKDLNHIVNQLSDYYPLTQEDIEREINTYLIELGYVYDTKANVWDK